MVVPVTRVVDYNVNVRVKSDGTGVDLANVKMSTNPFDEIAVEEAVHLREAGVATEVRNARKIRDGSTRSISSSQSAHPCIISRRSGRYFAWLYAARV